MFFIKHLKAKISIIQQANRQTNYNKDDGINWSSDGGAGLMVAISAERKGWAAWSNMAKKETRSGHERKNGHGVKNEPKDGKEIWRAK